MKAVLLRLHRWVALVFALPLLVVLVTGLILSAEPSIVVGAIKPGTLTAAKVEELLARHDAKAQARGIVHRSYDGTLTIGAGRGGGTVVDVATGEARGGPSGLANLLGTTRRLHETFLVDAGWLVTASTVAMLVLAALGVAMGLPRWSNTLAGWHKIVAWGLLPLVVLSPLTGLFIAMGISFTGTPPAPGGAGSSGRQGGQMSLVEAVRVVGQKHDLSALVWLRPQGGGLMARVVEGGEYRVYRVTREGTTPAPRNWPRLWHEGNFAGHWSALLNVVTSFALIGLLVTGAWIWGGRQVRLRARRAAKAATA